jgi:multidrug efflux system outer membrane protein
MRIPALLSILLLSGCAVGPNYKRPAAATPPVYRGGAAQPEDSSLGERKFAEVFQDKVLQALVQEALTNNRDIRVAAQRVLAGDGQIRATQAVLWPQVGGGSGVVQQRGNGSALNFANVAGRLSWEIDLFGRIRRATEAARADAAALQADEAAIRQVLVSQVASSYLQLRELDLELVVLRDSLKTRQDSVRLVTARMTGGVGTSMDVNQAESLVHQADASIARIEKGIEQTENLLSFLLARQPGRIERGEPLAAQTQPVPVPAGLPSSLIERRPDIRAAEQRLVAANARVGVAKAAFFPTITLTGQGGYQSVYLLNLVDRRGGFWGYNASLDVPLLDWGQRKGNYDSAKANAEAALQLYLKSIDSSFREVADALVGRQKAIEERERLGRLAETLRRQSRIADMRYRGGVSSYLEVLDTERERLTAEQEFARGQLGEALALVQLYKALGGGWQ